MNKREVRTLSVAQSLQTRAANNGTLKVAGTAIVFNKPADSGMGWFEVVDPGAVDRTLRERPDIRLLRDHDTSKLLARTKADTLQLTKDEQGLHFTATMQPTDLANDTWQNLRAGNLDGCSFGFICNDEAWDTMPDGTPLRRLLDVTLIELSICGFPFYTATTAEARARAAQMSRRDDDDDDDPNQDDLEGDLDPDGDEEDEDGYETCSCDCRACRQLRDCASCYSVRCDSRACRAASCPMQDEQRADALRLNQHFANIQANL